MFGCPKLFFHIINTVLYIIRFKGTNNLWIYLKISDLEQTLKKRPRVGGRRSLAQADSARRGPSRVAGFGAERKSLARGGRGVERPPVHGEVAPASERGSGSGEWQRWRRRREREVAAEARERGGVRERGGGARERSRRGEDKYFYFSLLKLKFYK